MGYWRHRRVLVTGVSGFLGAWLARRLVDEHAHVVTIVRDERANSGLDLLELREAVDTVRGDLTDYGTVERALNQYEVDACFHVAAQAIVGVANRAPRSTFESNILGTWNVLEAARVTGRLRSVVVASSDKAYGVQADLPYRESAPLLGSFPYDASKACADILSRSYASSFGLPVAVTRCANIYGGADLNWSRLIPGTIRSVLREERPVIRSDGSPLRDYLYVEDAASAYLATAEGVERGSVVGQALNFGGDRPFSALEVVQRCIKGAASDLEPDIQGMGIPSGEIDRQYLDSRRAREVLQWRPQVELDDGLARTVAWYRERRPLWQQRSDGLRAVAV